MKYNSQKLKIYNILKDGNWHCTSEFYALFMADPRRRICDLKEDGYIFEEPRRCQQHDYHRGGSKEWRLIGQKDKVIVLSGYAPLKREVLQGKLI